MISVEIFFPSINNGIIPIPLIFIYYDVGVKSPNYDACGLFCAMHSHNPPNYSHIVGLISHF
ncbi:hypothetical protein DWZ93_03330 [Dorea sp. AF36-15AT]|nr:hypothetical protein DWZ93_03330 [Dorea sp. AF36-15AT]